MSLTDEWALSKKLSALEGKHSGIFDNTTTFEYRREKARFLCKRWAETTFTVKDGKRITVGQMFRSTYQCDL